MNDLPYYSEFPNISTIGNLLTLFAKKYLKPLGKQVIGKIL